MVRYEGLRDLTGEVSRAPDRALRVAVFSGGKFSTSTELCARMLAILSQGTRPELPAHTTNWIARQRTVSRLSQAGRQLQTEIDRLILAADLPSAPLGG